jgi:signal transduction histidine kinase/CheY-like chemotaxis protein/HPt (histidine-containing phosphotransfer) domain-containing protein
MNPLDADQDSETNKCTPESENLPQQLRFVNGLSVLAKILLTEFENNQSALKSALDELTRTLEVDWAHICKKQTEANVSPGFKCIEKSSKLPQCISVTPPAPCRETLFRWNDRLSAGELIAGPVAAFSPEDRAFFDLLGVQSVLMVPLVSRNRFFGFLSIEDKTSPRQWKEAEQQIAKTAALMIGAYLARCEREETLLKAIATTKRANEMKSDFITNISHEIRTPLSSIIGFAEILKIENRRSEDHTSLSDAILKEANYLLGLISGLLDHAKLASEAFRLEPKPTDISALISDVSSTWRLSAQKKALVFGVERVGALPPQVMVDGQRLRQAISNLVSNGIKFTDQGGVTLRSEVLEQQSSRMKVRFSVTDTGVGIDEADHQKIFESFRQIDESPTRRFRGTGIGITIAQQLIRLMGGEIHLESHPGKGSRFWFDLSLPLGPSAATAPVDTSRSTNDDNLETNQTLSILVAEDNPTNQMIVRHHLERHNHRVIIASNGLEVLEQCKTHIFDLILMDIQMPEIDGIEATRRIRDGDTANKTVPIVAVTASAEKSVRDACLAAGMNDVIAKPLLFNTLLKALTRWQSPTPPDKQKAPRREPPAAAAKSKESDSVPIDVSILFERIGGDRNFAKILFDGFCRQTETMLKDMENSLASGDLGALCQAAHTIKGGALNIAATRLQTAAKSLEECALDSTSEAQPLLSELVSEYERLKIYLQKFF